jgi:hypothetical protein
MISNQQIQLNVCSEFIRQWQETPGAEPPEQDEERFLMVLKIREWQLRRVCKSDVLKMEHLPTLRHGVRTAELVLHSLQDRPPSPEAAELTSLLWMIVMQLTVEIVRTEEQFPHLKDAFDRERAEYRRMYDEAVEADAFD